MPNFINNKKILLMLILYGLRLHGASGDTRLMDYYIHVHNKIFQRIEHMVKAMGIDGHTLPPDTVKSCIDAMAVYTDLRMQMNHERVHCSQALYSEGQRALEEVHRSFDLINEMSLPAIKTDIALYSSIRKQMSELQMRMFDDFGVRYLPTLRMIDEQQDSYRSELPGLSIGSYSPQTTMRYKDGRKLLPVLFPSSGDLVSTGVSTHIKLYKKNGHSFFSPSIHFSPPFSTAMYASLWGHPEGSKALAWILLHEVGHVMQFHSLRRKKRGDKVYALDSQKQEIDADAYAIEQSYSEPAIKDGGVIVYAMELMHQPMHEIHAVTCTKGIRYGLKMKQIAHGIAQKPFAENRDMITHPAPFERLMTVVDGYSKTRRRELLSIAGDIVIHQQQSQLYSCPLAHHSYHKSIVSILMDAIENRIEQRIDNSKPLYKRMMGTVFSLFRIVRQSPVDVARRYIYTPLMLQELQCPYDGFDAVHVKAGIPCTEESGLEHKDSHNL